MKSVESLNKASRKVKETLSNIGILAYGSLLAEPGEELEAVIVDNIPTITPFNVEYARSSSGRSGAPTLVLVKRYGGKVQAKILVLAPKVDKQAACDMLYRREINRVGDTKTTYNDKKQREKDDAVVIEQTHNFENVATVLYASLQPNISQIQAGIPLKEKAKVLADLAINSVTQETYSKERDGIQYLADAIKNGIETPLTKLYEQRILSETNTTDLASARDAVAKKKDLA